MDRLSGTSMKILILTTAVFIALIVITMKLDAQNMVFGFPWAFYSYSSIGDELGGSSSWSFQPVFFILEWLMIAVLVIALNKGLKRIRQ